VLKAEVKGKGKGFPYSIPSVGPGADPGVQAVSPQVTESHPVGTKLYCLVTEAHGVNNLPKVVTQRHLEQDLNSRPVDRKPKRLTRCTIAPLVIAA